MGILLGFAMTGALLAGFRVQIALRPGNIVLLAQKRCPEAANNVIGSARSWRALLFAPDAQAEAVQINLLRFLFTITGSAALDIEAEEGPQGQRFAGVIVAVRVAVAFQQPAPGSPLAAWVGLFLPTFEHPRHGLQSGPASFGIPDMEPQFLCGRLGFHSRNGTYGLKKSML